MNITFINHNQLPRVNMGLAYIMSVVGQTHSVELYDILFREKTFAAYIAKRVRINKPDFFCFSVNSFTFKKALHWASICHQLCPDVPRICGGVHPTLFPEEVVQHPLVDYVCIGEGEETIVDFLSRYSEDPEVLVPGMWHKSRLGIVRRTPLREFVQKIDALPMINWAYWDMEHYLKLSGLFRGAIRVLASRGCPNHCSYCSVDPIRQAVPGQYYRCRDPKRVVDEMVSVYYEHQPFGAAYIQFDDASFGMNRPQLKAIISELKNRGINDSIPWSCKAYPDVIDEEWTRLCKSGGCFHVACGIESADENIRSIIFNRRTPNSTIKNALVLLNENNILYSLYFILCAPTETIQSLFKSLLMIMRSRAVKVFACYFFPLPKTHIASRKECSVVSKKNKWDDAVFRFPDKYIWQQKPFIALMSYIGITIAKLALYLKSGFAARKGSFLKDIVVKWILCYKKKRVISSHVALMAEIYKNHVLDYVYQQYMNDKHKDKVVHNEELVPDKKVSL